MFRRFPRTGFFLSFQFDEFSHCWEFPGTLRIMGSQTGTSKLHKNSQNQGTIGCTPNSVPMVFIVFSRDSWGL